MCNLVMMRTKALIMLSNPQRLQQTISTSARTGQVCRSDGRKYPPIPLRSDRAVGSGVGVKTRAPRIPTRLPLSQFYFFIFIEWVLGDLVLKLAKVLGNAGLVYLGCVLKRDCGFGLMLRFTLRSFGRDGLASWCRVSGLCGLICFAAACVSLPGRWFYNDTVPG